MAGQEELFAAVDALLEQASGELPPPAERARLRRAAGLSQQQVAAALKLKRRETVADWESGRSEPRPPQRAAYLRLLEGLATRYPAPEAAEAATAPAPVPGSAPDSGPPAARSAEPAAGLPPVAAEVPPPASADSTAVRRSPEPPQVPAPKPSPLRSEGTAGSRPRKRRANSPSPPEESTSGGSRPRFANGPLAVLDGDGTAYCTGGLVLDCPARTLVELVEWALGEADLGAARLHRSGRDADPLLVLTEPAALRYGLPPRLEDRRNLRLPDDHPLVREIVQARWQLTRRGFGPWPRIYRPAEGGTRRCVQFAVLPWDALERRTWGDAASLPPARLAQVLGEYAQHVLTPRGSAAVNGLELMTALRPPTRAVHDPASGGYVSAPVPGSLTVAVDPAPPEAPEEHPVAVGRPADDALDEEAHEWIRDPQLLTDAECASGFAVGLDVNMAFAAAANRLAVGLCAPEHVKAPVFDKKTPGCWLVDLSHIDTDPRLPNPFTAHGGRPGGPAWYATPTVAYAAELGHSVRPVEAYLRPESGPYLDPWYQRLRDAYLATMEQLGVTPGLDEAAFLAAMAVHKQADPARAAVLSAVKATVKGGIGKLRERPQGARYRPGQRWPALERPTWRPDIRAAVIASARVNMHRKMRRLAEGAGLFPLAVLSDCAVYASPGPSPVDLLPRAEDGRPLPGGFRLGVSPGMVKHEGTRPFLWAAELLDAGHNPARHIKDDAPDTGADEGGE
ncbi:telomere-associated protein Tap [Streptomyces ovatisporus]|uniref:Telomere-associated protein Tap n=1 Tax=Streptomyces ovatisporus TaxID=1128682 RepID=A0ABV9A4Y4_9ACTN